MESSLTSSNSLVPDKIIKTLGLYASLAWYNITSVLKEAREMELPPCTNKNDQTRIVTNYQTSRLYVDDFFQPFGKCSSVDRLE